MQPEVIYRQIMEEGGFEFLKNEAYDAYDRVKKSCPEGVALLTDPAKQSMIDRFCDRLSIPYAQVMIKEVLENAAKDDPLGTLISGGEDSAAIKAAIRRVIKEMGNETGRILTERYPLLKDYSKRLTDNYVESQAALLNHLLEKKDEISEKLLGGRSFEKVLDLTGDAGDIHRHGQCVQRIVTDAGTCYYKPHDMGLDQLFYELVQRWFSDSVVCGAVVRGDGYGFAEELKIAELSDGQDPGEYYYHLGVLTALFHALGSTDMHHENILAVGTRPAAIDLETLLKGKPSRKQRIKFAHARTLTETEKDLEGSVERTAILPGRIYKGGMVGILYCESPDTPCQPFRGKTPYNIRGYETQYLKGFKDGYHRVLENRGALKEQVSGYGKAVVRFVSKNTAYYYTMRALLYSPEALLSEEGQAKVLARLRVPYRNTEEEIVQKTISYESQCLTQGDIPYYCTSVFGHDLCGFDPDEIVVENCWEESAWESFQKKIDRLSEEEARFEMDYIRASLDHAPCTVNAAEDAHESPISENTRPLSASEAALLCKNVWEDLIRDRILSSEGTALWKSGLQGLYMEHTLGVFALQADAACYAGTLLGIPALREIHPEAAGLCSDLTHFFSVILGEWEQEEDKILRKMFVLDEEGGLGCLIRSLEVLRRAGIEGAKENLERILRLACRLELKKDLRRTGGEVGLLLELCAPDHEGVWDTAETDRLIKNLAEEIAAAERPKKPEETAKRAAALALASVRTKEERVQNEAQESFRILLNSYQPKMPGWGEADGPVKWLVTPGKAEAAIGRMAHRVLRCGVGIPEAEKVHSLALEIVKNQGVLLREDTLKKGNAASALYLTEVFEETGAADCIDIAGKILSSMVSRREKTGAYICSPPGIRNFFDASITIGSLGAGMAAAAYLKSKEKTE